MNFRTNILLFSFLLTTIPTFATSKTDPIYIDPVITQLDSISKLTKPVPICVGIIADSTFSHTHGIIGRTRTGIKVTAPIKVKPSLSESIKKSIELSLKRSGNLSTDASLATLSIDITILDCTLTESTSFLTQTMDGYLRMQVKLSDPQAADKSILFTVESRNSTKALDTSNYASDVLKENIKSAIGEIFATIEKSYK